MDTISSLWDILNDINVNNISGVVVISFFIIILFAGCMEPKMGRKPLLIVGSIGMAVGAFCVAFCDEFQQRYENQRGLGGFQEAAESH